MVPIFLALAKRLISQARAMDLKIHTKRSYGWQRVIFIPELELKIFT
jgi:hypothetical protein